MKVSADNLLFTCEHGGNDIPPPYRKLFADSTALLNSHRGLDTGALATARHLARFCQVKLCYSETSRLLIDLNRSLHHPGLFSTITKPCPEKIKQGIISTYYLPYRKCVLDQLKQIIHKNKFVVHFSMHSFTPRLAGHVRNTDIGLLYDPKRLPEKKLCKKIKTEILQISDDWRIRYNYPYRGNADGLTTGLRKQFGSGKYLGIEIEINQKIFGNKEKTMQLHQTLSKMLGNILSGR